MRFEVRQLENAEISIDPEYDMEFELNPFNAANDIATITFSNPISGVNPVKFVRNIRNTVMQRKEYMVAGAGRSEHWAFTGSMYTANATFQKNKQFRRQLPNMLKVTLEEGFYNCKGDSGGPLYFADKDYEEIYQIGITSLIVVPKGKNCGIYTKMALLTSDKVDWIVAQ